MLDDKNLTDYENKNLSEVFKELQSIKSDPKSSKQVSKEYLKKEKEKARQKQKEKQAYLKHKNTNYAKAPKKQEQPKENKTEEYTVNQILNPIGNNTTPKHPRQPREEKQENNMINQKNTKFIKSKKKNKFNTKKEKTTDIRISHIITGLGLIALSSIVLFPKDIKLTKNFKLEDISSTTAKYELNKHYINSKDILESNKQPEIIKQQTIEERNTTFNIKYLDIPTLPSGEQTIKQPGVLGKDKYTIIKSTTNGELTDELIINREKITEPTEQIVEYGTSDFLAKLKIHLGDTIYLKNDYKLKAEPDINSEDKAEIIQYLNVQITDLPNEEWCKVLFDGIEGYIQTNNLTSKEETKDIEEKSRIQRIMLTIKPDMELNKPSGLTLDDYKKIFNYNSEDKNNIFHNHLETFYNVEQKYNINGVFLASIAIHESNWGTSEIAKEKHNLFGYGSYDRSPFESSMSFDTYEENIDTVARALVKYYLNPAGTPIYNGEIAQGTYFNGPTLEGVNTKYASDPEWHNKIFKHMQELYNKIRNNNSYTITY